MRIVYMGSDELAVPALNAFFEHPELEVVCVVSQPDRPVGRKMKLQACPAKVRALELGLPVHSPEKIGSADSVGYLSSLSPELQVVVAYGQYIPSSVLSIPPLENINLHPSMLPRYRGAAPIQMAIADGLSETGITVLYVSKEMDAGDIVLQTSHPILPSDDAVSLKQKLAVAGADLLVEAAMKLKAGAATRTPQDEDRATYVKKLTREDGIIDWTQSADEIHNRVRAFRPWPGSTCTMPNSAIPLKIHEAQRMEGQGTPGEVLQTINGLQVAAGQGALELVTVQPPGKRKMSADDFLKGHDLEVGAVLR